MLENKRSVSYLLFYYWVWVAAYCILIFYLSSKPINVRMPSIRHIDKILHLLEYGVLSFFLTRAFFHSFSLNKLTIRRWVVFFTLCYGISDELHQYFVPARDADIVDVLFDGFGAIAGFYLFFYSERLLKRRDIV